MWWKLKRVSSIKTSMLESFVKTKIKPQKKLKHQERKRMMKLLTKKNK